MDVFVNRNPTGCETFDLEDLKELEEQLGSFSALGPLDDKSEVKVEITGTWAEIKELLSQPYFKDIWFDPETSPNAVGYCCDNCEVTEWDRGDRLPKGWVVAERDGIKVFLCPKCKK